MSDVTENICATVSKELVEDVLKNYYGFVNGKIKQLDGYDDKNFHITHVEQSIEGIEFPADGIVIKFINSIDSKNLSLLDAQTKLAQYLENSGITCPTPVFNKYNQSYQSITIDSKTHAVRVYKYVKGETMKNIKFNLEVSADFGSYVGNLTSILKKFDHEGFHRDDHMWALEKSPDVLQFVEVFDDEKKRQIIIAIINKFKSDVLLKSDKLEKSVIHEDLSMNNMIIKDNKIVGIIDLGDVVHSFTIFDFTVALSYFILHEFEDDNANLSAIKMKIKSFVDSYEKQYRNLNDLELSMIHACVCARICQSLVLGKKSSLRDLSNTYILSTQKYGWKALEELINIQKDEFIKFLKN